LDTIWGYAFESCTDLTSIHLPYSLTRILDGAFYNCSTLASVTINNPTPPTLGPNAFDGTHATLRIYVPSASVDTYKTTPGWSNYASKIAAITP
jgi:hypothetical protein